MAGKRRKRTMKLSAETTKDQRSPIRGDPPSEEKRDGLELQSWSDLPADLLERVFSPSTLIENVRASAVCKPWLTVAVSFRKENKPPPWLMYIPTRGAVFEFYDPCTHKSYTVELRELLGHSIYESKYGWLLVRGPVRSIAFFHPFNRVMIKLPNLPMTCPTVCFSCAPTDPSCVVFAFTILGPDTAAISTCHLGAEMWSTSNYQNKLPYAVSIWNKFIFCSSLFYCLTVTGWLGIFNPKERTWEVLAVSRPTSFDNFYDNCWWEGRFYTEHNGDLLATYTSWYHNPGILKLDGSVLEWKIIESLDDATVCRFFLDCSKKRPPWKNEKLYLLQEGSSLWKALHIIFTEGPAILSAASVS